MLYLTSLKFVPIFKLLFSSLSFVVMSFLPVFRLTLFVTVLVLTFLSPAHPEKDLSLFEFFLTILTSTSSFVISQSPVTAILILTDPSLISNIKSRLERFLVNRSSSSTSLVTSNSIGLESNGPQAPIWPELPADIYDR